MASLIRCDVPLFCYCYEMMQHNTIRTISDTRRQGKAANRCRHSMACDGLFLGDMETINKVYSSVQVLDMQHTIYECMEVSAFGAFQVCHLHVA